MRVPRQRVQQRRLGLLALAALVSLSGAAMVGARGESRSAQGAQAVRRTLALKAKLGLRPPP